MYQRWNKNFVTSEGRKNKLLTLTKMELSGNDYLVNNLFNMENIKINIRT